MIDWGVKSVYYGADSNAHARTKETSQLFRGDARFVARSSEARRRTRTYASNSRTPAVMQI